MKISSTAERGVGSLVRLNNQVAASVQVRRLCDNDVYNYSDNNEQNRNTCVVNIIEDTDGRDDYDSFNDNLDKI